MLVLVNGNKLKKDRQQHNSTSNFVSANSLIAKFIRYDASSIASLCVKIIYSEKATKFCEIFALLLSYVVQVKSKVKISQNFVAFSE